MDPISHAVIGSAVAALVPAGTHQAAVWGILIGAELPDIDFVVRLWHGHAGYLKAHRGPTHGLLSLAVGAGVVASLLRLIWPAAAWVTVFQWTLLGCLSHVLFDCANDYGTKALWPFSGRRMAWDIIPIVDFYVLGLIGVGWVMNGLWTGHRQPIFAIVWTLILIYAVARMVLRRSAWYLVAGQFDLSQPCGEFVPCGEGWNDEIVSIHPTLLSLTCWRFVVRTNGAFLTGRVWPLKRKVGRAERARNERDKIVEASLKGVLVDLFAAWARRPRVQVDRMNGLYRVRWTDMRYEFDEVSPFSVYAWLDDNLRLVDEGFAPRSPENLAPGGLMRRLRLEMGKPDE